jgi:glutaredoxin 3
MIGLRHREPPHRKPSADPMAEVEIYTTPLCPYCWRAKRLLSKKGVAFVEIDLWRHPERRAEMELRAGGRTTVPQIFVDGRAIGGSDELALLETRGDLDAVLGGG